MHPAHVIKGAIVLALCIAVAMTVVLWPSRYEAHYALCAALAIILLWPRQRSAWLRCTFCGRGFEGEHERAEGRPVCDRCAREAA